MVLLDLERMAVVQLTGSAIASFVHLLLIVPRFSYNTQEELRMLTTLFNQALTHAGDLFMTVLLSPPPLDPTNLLKDIFTWLVRILGAVGMLYFVIDLFKHVASSPRDLGAAGKDALIMVILLVVAAKADVLVTWAQNVL